MVRSMTNKAIVAVFLMCAALPAAANAIDRIVDPYLKIQSALAADTLEPVKPQAATIAKEAESLGMSGRELKAAAEQLERAGDLKAARDAFGTLTKAVLGYAAATKSDFGADVHEAYCPMIRKSWLQKGEKIQNPYYGPSMAGCGEIKKKQ